MHIKIGTRSSKLAMWQAEFIAGQLQEAGATTEFVTFETKGDKILDKSLSKIGSKGLFTEELESSLRTGEIDIAVHSAKDLQSHFEEDLEIIAFTKREQDHDVLISKNKDLTLNDKVVVGTSSTRRRAFMKHYYPNVDLVEMRGNLQTRLQKLDEGQCDAILLAFAGVHRMGYDEFIVDHLDRSKFVPPVGQGSVAVQICNTKLSTEKTAFVRDLCNHEETEKCLIAERKYLEILDGGCSVPVFANAILTNNEITINGGVVGLEGENKIEFKLSTSELSTTSDLGEALAKKVVDAGGKELLDDIKTKLKK